MVDLQKKIGKDFNPKIIPITYESLFMIHDMFFTCMYICKDSL